MTWWCLLGMVASAALGALAIAIWWIRFIARLDAEDVALTAYVLRRDLGARVAELERKVATLLGCKR